MCYDQVVENLRYANEQIASLEKEIIMLNGLYKSEKSYNSHLERKLNAIHTALSLQEVEDF